MAYRVKKTTRTPSHTAEIILMVGLIGALVWNIQGQSCTSKEECMPNIACHTVPWFCNASGSTSSQAAPTPDPTSSCCIHLGTCGDAVEVAGWVNVRNTSLELDGTPYSAEWLDTFITEGNSTTPSVIKTMYVGSWSTLKKENMRFPSQMFVAEPTNSCTVDGEPKWPEWYQVTVNVVSEDTTDSTLLVETKRPRDCLCDVEWDCLNEVCWVETQNTSKAGASLSITSPALEVKVAQFCRSNESITVVNYTASSQFATGFGPEQSVIDSFNFATSVEGGWGPDLDDTNMWIQVKLDKDTIISGIMTQGVAVNPERRVDEFMVEYQASDSASSVVGGDTIFKAGARLETKMINSFPTPLKANRVRLLISKPCDPYYVGLRFELLGCPACEVKGDCTEPGVGTCEAEKFCTYEESTTLMPTTRGETTEPITSDMPTLVGGQTTVMAGETTDDQGAMTGSSRTLAPPASTSQLGLITTPRPDVPTATEQTTGTPPGTQLEEKINEVTQNLKPEIKTVVEELLLVGNKLDDNSDTDVTDPTTYPTENVTIDAIKAGLEVIRNITVEANATQNSQLQVQIVKSAWNFLAAVSTTNEFVQDDVVDEDLLNEYMAVASLIVDKDRKEAWKEVQDGSVAGPLGIVTSVESVAKRVAVAIRVTDAAAPFDVTIPIAKANIEGLIRGQTKENFLSEDYVHKFSNEDPKQLNEVTITKKDFHNNNRVTGLPANASLVVVVLKFSSIADVLDENDVQDKTPLEGKTKRVASSILSVSVVSNQTISLPLTFRLGHDPPKPEEKQFCNFWKIHNKITGEWSRKGCTTSDSMPGSTKCFCNHMTNYAVLMWLGEKPREDNETLELISKVGLLVSISALALAVGLLLFLRSSLSSERIIIHLHLMSVTLVALILYLAAIDKTENRLVCQFITIALHFFYLAMFSWMLVEGIHLYRQIIAVFDSGKSRLWFYFVIGWGIPIIVVGITSGIFFDQYKNHKLCWLEIEDYSIWAFLGPLIPILLINFIVLLMVSRIVMSAAKLQQEKPGFNSAKAGLRSSLLLLPILGVTWVVGYFIHLHTALEYAFVVLNAFQGFFMALFHCFMSSEVNTALKQKIRKVKESSLGGASTTDSLHPKCFMNAEKAPLYEVTAPLDTGIDLLYDLYE